MQQDGGGGRAGWCWPRSEACGRESVHAASSLRRQDLGISRVCVARCPCAIRMHALAIDGVTMSSLNPAPPPEWGLSACYWLLPASQKASRVPECCCCCLVLQAGCPAAAEVLHIVDGLPGCQPGLDLKQHTCHRLAVACGEPRHCHRCTHPIYLHSLATCALR